MPSWCEACHRPLCELAMGSTGYCHVCLSRFMVRWQPDDSGIQQPSFLHISLFHWGSDEACKQLVKKWKYDLNRSLAKRINIEVAALVRQNWSEWKPDYLAAVPSSRLNGKTGPHLRHLVHELKSLNSLEVLYPWKVKSGASSQHTKNRLQRQFEVSQMFDLAKKTPDLRDKTVLFLDDVSTTGSTARECGKLLLQQGAKRVVCLTIYRRARESTDVLHKV